MALPTNKIKIVVIGGIGDLLFITPTVRLIKETYPDVHVHVAARNFRELLKSNPYIDSTGVIFPGMPITYEDGLLLKYPNMMLDEKPMQHHIMTTWEQVCKHYKLDLPEPRLQPEIYLPRAQQKKGAVGVQVFFKVEQEWRKKKRWPYIKELLQFDRFEPIRMQPSIEEFIYKLSQYPVVVCCEGGVSHLAKALGIPAVVVYGGFAKPEWNGYTDQLNVVSEPDCKWCYNNKRCDLKCMKSIPVAPVHNLAKGVLFEMGNVISKHGECELDKSMLSTRLIVEDCENIHVHYRDLRLEFSPNEFLMFANAMDEAKRRLINNDRPKENNYRVLSERKIREHSDYWSDRFVVERNKKCFHIHYKNFRLEVAPEEYQKITEAIGIHRLLGKLPLDMIDAYGYGHPETITEEGFPSKESFENHSKRIEEVRQAMRDGKRITPIAVEVQPNGTFKRLDGYCRYQAHKLEGLEDIECYLTTYAKKGCQDGMPFVAKE